MSHRMFQVDWDVTRRTEAAAAAAFLQSKATSTIFRTMMITILSMTRRLRVPRSMVQPRTRTTSIRTTTNHPLPIPFATMVPIIFLDSWCCYCSWVSMVPSNCVVMIVPSRPPLGPVAEVPGLRPRTVVDVVGMVPGVFGMAILVDAVAEVRREVSDVAVKGIVDASS
jgi:hypothetical protein